MIRIVGGGFSGLATAYFLTKRGVRVEILEAKPRLGGLIQTHTGGYGLVETAANGVLNSALVEEVAADLGLTLQGTRRDSRKRYLWHGRPRRWPLTWWQSLAFVWHIVRGYFVRGKNSLAPRAFETIEAWGARNLGAPFEKKVLSVALQGIYAAPGARLSASLILGRFFRPRRGHAKVKPKLRGTVAPAGGMGDWSRAFEAWLKAHGVTIELSKSVTPEDVASWKPGTFVIATSLATAARLTSARAPQLGALLASLPTLPVVTITAFYEPTAGDMHGFGCLFPRTSGFAALGVLFPADIFEGRSTKRAETWIYQGTGLETEWLTRLAADRQRLSGSAAVPLETRVTMWPEGLPLYDTQLEAKLPKIFEESEHAGITLAGNYLGRLGLAQLLEGAADTAERLVAQAAAVPPAPSPSEALLPGDTL